MTMKNTTIIYGLSGSFCNFEHSLKALEELVRQGAEVIPAAVEDAKANAARNGVTNAEFLCADAAQAAQTLADRGLRPDVICVDPPRKGLAPAVIDAIVQMAPQRLVYVSCDPATLARDVKRMEEQGYVLQRAEAVDLFPRTAHVETVCLLSKLKY